MRNTAWLGFAVALVIGCGGGESFEVSDDSDGAVDGDDASSGDGSADSDLADSGTTDSADDTGSDDTGVDDTGVGDTGTTDTGAVDSGSADSMLVDSTITDSGMLVDSGTDTGAPDTGPGDTGVVDTGTDTGCAPGTSQSCYGGAASELTGATTACRAGIQYCIGGTFGPCIGEVRPSAESCNGLDDDCNGTADDGLGTVSCGIGACGNTVPACAGGKPSTCAPKAASAEVCGNAVDEDCDGVVNACGCVYVAPTGAATDSAACGSTALPCKTIQYAINKAGTGSWPTQVCVASTFGCSGSGATTNYDENVTMKNGVSVLGHYDPNSWGRNANCVTRVRAQNATGVLFDATVTSPTTLDQMDVLGHADAVSAAVTVTGSTGAILDDCVVSGGGTTDSVGVLVQDSSGTKAKPIIRNSAITGGNGSGLTIGIRVVKSSPTILRNCDAFEAGTGRCTSYGCFGTNHFVRGRNPSLAGPGASTATSGTYAVKLEDAAGTVVDTSALCSYDGRADVAGLRLSGDATGVVLRQNNIVANAGNTGNVNSVGVWADACNGASPWIVDNFHVSGQSRTVGGRADGVRAIGDCHPRIDSNRQIVGGDESAANDANGVYCAMDPVTMLSSKCTVLFNETIWGSGGGFPPNATGVRCDAGACARIERNRTISGNQGTNTYGVVLNGASTFVDGNGISAGCTRGGEGIGILSIDAPARVQNNFVFGGNSCTTGSGAANPATAYGVRVQIGTGVNELDLHSNTVMAMGFAGMCTGRALSFEALVGSSGGSRGVIRDNILHSGSCSTNYVVFEASAAADPRIFQNNDLWYSVSPAALYRDEGSTNLTTLGAVNGLTDILSSGNISADPVFVGATNFHIQSSSPCRNAGLSSGAPTTDYDQALRPQESVNDIGADEFKP